MENTLADSAAQGSPPDAVACWQNLAAACENYDAAGARGRVCIGIVCVLSVCESLAFWYALFRCLGFSVRVPKHNAAGINAPHAKGRETIPSESVCYPAKLSHIYAADVVERGANVVFMPTFQRHARCPVSCEYANALKYNMFEAGGDECTESVACERWAGAGSERVVDVASDGCVPKNQVHMLCPNLLLRKPIHMLKIPSEAQNLRVAINEVIVKIDAQLHVGADEFMQALEHAALTQRTFNDVVAAENERAFAWAHAADHHGILLVGRPYHWNRSLLHDVNYLLTSLGFSVLTYHPALAKKKKREVVPELLLHGGLQESEQSSTTPPSAFPREMGNLCELEEIGSVAEALPYWRAAKHMTRLCEEVGADAHLDIVCLQSFGCGYDAASVAGAREVMHSHNKPFTLLMIDDVVNSSAVRVRLRTLAAAINQRKLKERLESCTSKGTCNCDGQGAAADQLQKSTVADNVGAAPLPHEIMQAAQNEDIRAFCALEVLDYDASRAFCENYCYLAALFVGRAYRICAQLPTLKVLRVPYVCYGCLLDALVATLSRALGREIEIVWERDWHALGMEGVCESDKSGAADFANNNVEGLASDAVNLVSNKTAPKIGIIGAPALVFEPVINDNLVSLIKNNGCTPILPRVPYVLEDDILFTKQLQLYYNQGVRDVIYLMSFGCLKGHVQVRAKMPLVRRNFPGMRLTIIDFDGDASSLNRTNRALLAISCAKETK